MPSFLEDEDAWLPPPSDWSAIRGLRSLSRADLSGADLQQLRTKDTGQTVLDMLSVRLEALSIDEHKAAEREAWKNAWDAVIQSSSVLDATDLDADYFRCPARSNIDSTYFDADDNPFEMRDWWVGFKVSMYYQFSQMNHMAAAGTRRSIWTWESASSTTFSS